MASKQLQRLAASGSRTAQRRRDKRPDARLVLQRAQSDPASLQPADILQLQRTIGNRATGRLLSSSLPIQAKLEVGPVNDVHEQEADRVAREVVRRTSSPQTVAQNEVMGLQRQPLAAQISGVQRMGEEDELAMKRETLQRDEDDELDMQRKTVQRSEEDELAMKREADPSYRDGGTLDTSLEQSIRQAKGGGQAMDRGVQRQMESGFGATFGGVRIHTDFMADKLTRSVQAKAFTTGKDIFFKRGEYNPGSRAGKELLAHELTHTVQQGAADVGRKPNPRGFRVT
ncbi:MAG: DUF4157 domain-containing protein [Caldilineaceae bacterium]